MIEPNNDDKSSEKGNERNKKRASEREKGKISEICDVQALKCQFQSFSSRYKAYVGPI